MKLSTIIKYKLREELDTKRFPFNYSYEEFLNDKDDYDKMSETINLINKHFQKGLKFEKEYFDFIVGKNSQIIISLEYYFRKSKKAEKDYSDKSYSYTALNHFWMIFTVITNNYITLKDLFTQGKDYQAKIIFRNTIELTELCIGILGDEEFYTFFQKQNNVDDPTKNFQTLKYDTIKKTSNKIIKEIKKLPNNNINEELWDEYQKMNIMTIHQSTFTRIFSI
ncbi:hypothetical protein HNP38_002291 [Chryseobacterium defluvii]|uniref:Uncharacterized protein n=1 Tax=Chryseobacterium defluvii TaxID=160396 RepID=A0A840KEI9_9FLAO|nr:hypothetical protein [Chryseobacterium defluvii]MBB4806995.1 hypothetical protein [Chryseobacterium defluvii]